MGRDHTSIQALKSIETATKIFPHRLSLDFIWGLPNQTINDWKQELEIITSFKEVNHLSLYQLVVERGTIVYNQVDSKKVFVPRNDLLDDLADITLQV